jgi:hypothetical protein
MAGVPGVILTTVMVLSSVSPGQERIATDVRRIVKERETLGDRLLASLNDGKRDAHERALAATQLGELEYAPAIPALIKHLLLRDGKAVVRPEWDMTIGYPCAKALMKFGREITAPVIRRYVEEENELYRQTLSAVLVGGSRQGYRDDAILFARGFGYELSDRRQVDRLIDIYTFLHEDKGAKAVIPPEWLKDK